MVKMRRKSKNHCYFGCGSFEQGMDEEDLERLLQHHLKIVSLLLKLSYNIFGLFPSNMCLNLFVHACFNPS